MTDRELLEKALEALDQMYKRAASLDTQEASDQDLQNLADNPMSGEIALEAQEVLFIRGAITALRERLAQPEQEPVAWLVQYSNKHEFVWGQKPQWIADAIGIDPLYTAPPRREWVGLTDEEELMIGVATGMTGVAIRMIEAKLKEKNK